MVPIGTVSVYQKFSPESEADMAYAERRDSAKGPRYRGFYKGTDGRYKSAGTYTSHERAYEVAEEEERHARGFLEDSVNERWNDALVAPDRRTGPNRLDRLRTVL